MNYSGNQRRTLFYRLFVLNLFLLMTPVMSKAQHHQEAHDPDKQTHPVHGYFRASVVLSHTLIPTDINGQRENLYIPSWGLDIEYWFNHEWGLGLHNDVELETFEVFTPEGESLDREYPVVLTLDVLWRPWKELVLLMGPGIEIESDRNLQVMRFGTEYEIKMSEHWDLAPNFFYDLRKDAYDTWSFGLGIGRTF
jgi:hypothetical protein